MKKAIMVLILLVMLAPSAHAKTSRQVISELSIDGIVTNTATAIEFAAMLKAFNFLYFIVLLSPGVIAGLIYSIFVASRTKKTCSG